MPSKEKPTPVRLRAERAARVDAVAGKRGISRHAALLDIIDAGLVVLEGAADPKIEVPRGPLGAVREQLAGAGQVLRELEKAVTAAPAGRLSRDEFRDATKDVPVGREAPPAGSMLKGPKGKRK